jgi:hypothetical protein
MPQLPDFFVSGVVAPDVPIASNPILDTMRQAYLAAKAETAARAARAPIPLTKEAA